MPFRPADNSPFRRHYAPMGATRRSLLCLCMCDGFSIAHRRENARIIVEAPPVAEKARRFRGSVPVFTPKGAGNRLTRRCSESPKRRQKPMVSGLPFLSRAAFVMGRKGNRLCNKPAAAPSQVKGRVGLPLGEYGSPRPVCGLVSGMTGGWQGGKRALSPVGRAPFCMEKYQSLTCSGRLSP